MNTIATLQTHAARAGLLAMLHNGEIVVRRGQHRVWRIQADGRRVFWQPTPKDRACEIGVGGMDKAVRLVVAALKSFRPGRTDSGVSPQQAEVLA